MAKVRSKNRTKTATNNGRKKVAEKWIILERAHNVINISKKRKVFYISKDMLKTTNKPIVRNYGKRSARIVNSYEGQNLTLSMENVVSELESAIIAAEYPLEIVWDIDGVKIIGK
jgi:hypothetical protein